MKLSVLMPVHNEVRTVANIVERVLAVPLEQEIVLVNDGSSDGTSGVVDGLTSSRVKAIRHPTNQGKGAALRAGFRRALDDGYGAVLTLDADGQHDPAEIPRFLRAYAERQSDLIIGARDFRQIPPLRRVANTLGRWSFSWALGQPVRDNQSGYRLISRRTMEAALPSRENGFEFEVEMIVTCVEQDFVLDWVSIRTIYAGEKSHINPWQHVVNFLRLVWQTRQRTRQMGREA